MLFRSVRNGRGPLLRSLTSVFYNEQMPDERAEGEEFRPVGAVAFFTAMLVFFGAVWLFFCFLMIHRH